MSGANDRAHPNGVAKPRHVLNPVVAFQGEPGAFTDRLATRRRSLRRARDSARDAPPVEHATRACIALSLAHRPGSPAMRSHASRAHLGTY